MPAHRQLLRVTLVRSPIGCPKDQKATVKALGLNRLGKSVVVPDNPSVRGMVRKVAHLVRWEAVERPAPSEVTR
ncbi:50S ribosomal protein L30 [bacterium HR17]|uniref:50S ribosomal protein L30 n=1 Tax=Candidatus Fervidibacter japonicus TaxID=2035412 RepID=A0A2H5XDL2_9BACT|nr:50S ribosomal protein L30 [bacterium HR17]